MFRELCVPLVLPGRKLRLGSALWRGSRGVIMVACKGWRWFIRSAAGVGRCEATGRTNVRRTHRRSDRLPRSRFLSEDGREVRLSKVSGFVSLNSLPNFPNPKEVWDGKTSFIFDRLDLQSRPRVHFRPPSPSIAPGRRNKRRTCAWHCLAPPAPQAGCSSTAPCSAATRSWRWCATQTRWRPARGCRWWRATSWTSRPSLAWSRERYSGFRGRHLDALAGAAGAQQHQRVLRGLWIQCH
jgi:hypothetical protein